MQIAQGRDKHKHAILTPGQALILWVVLAIIVADVVALLAVLGMMTVWEAAVTIFAVLAVAAGAIWTLLLVPHKRTHEAEESGSPESSPETMPMSE
jgi:membrane protein YdbS with pleckstrin-like domain